jgi:hypothetical protein
MNNGQALTDMSWFDDYIEDVANHIVKHRLMEQQIQDPIVLKVLSKYYERSQLGIQKYGRTLDRDDLSLTDWLNHLQEELMDATLYIEKLKADVKFIEQKTGQG